MFQVKIDTRNSDSLREARLIVSCLEKEHGLTSDEMLKCAEGDPRLTAIDSFELIDWHYNLDLINALQTRIIGPIHAVSCDTPVFSMFRYHEHRAVSRVLINTAERELQLVA